MLNAAAEREKSFEAEGDAVFHLLRRHAGIKRRDHDDWNVDRREHVDRHARDADRAQNRDDEARDNDEVGSPDGES